MERKVLAVLAVLVVLGVSGCGVKPGDRVEFVVPEIVVNGTPMAMPTATVTPTTTGTITATITPTTTGTITATVTPTTTGTITVTVTPTTTATTGTITATIADGSDSITIDLTANDSVSTQETYKCTSNCSLSVPPYIVVGFISGSDKPGDWKNVDINVTGYGKIATDGRMTVHFEENEEIRFHQATADECTVYSASTFCQMLP